MIAASILLNATLVMTLALGAARIARKARAAVRHAMLAAAFAILLILPAASLAAPLLRVPVPAAIEDAIVPLVAAPPDAGSGTMPASEAIASPASPHLSWPSTSSPLFAIWAVGIAVFLLPVTTGLWQLRSIRRSALPWIDGQALVDRLAAASDVHRRVELLLHESLPGPMTCGVLHPAVVLPVDARTWAAEDVQRAIIHEMEHIRRGDWISHCAARIVASCYWFHPIVWVAWRQLSLEAERACDDAVVSRSEATAYADQLVGMAQRLSATSNQPQLAMANRRDLSARVRAVLDATQRRGRAGAASLAVVIAATAVLAMTMSSIRIVAAARPVSAQVSADRSAAKQKFDAATIKPCDVEEPPTGQAGGRWRSGAGGTDATFSPGRFYVPCVTTEQLIYLAYASYGARDDERLQNDDPGTASNAAKIRGGPSWVHSARDKYQIEATAVGATERTVLMGSMLQSLLEDRFHLKIHRDAEDAPLLTLVTDKSGLKLKPMKDGDCDPDAEPGLPQNGGKPKCGNLMMGMTAWTFNGFDLSSLASQLSRAIGIHVVDKTGVTDKFIFAFTFERNQDGTTSDTTMNTALQDQLGLKLDRTKGPRGFIVIDAIERPTPDGPFVLVSAPSRAAGARGQRR